MTDMDMAVALVLILSALAWGVIASTMAQRRGRNDRAWFFAGMAFGLFAVVYLLRHPAPLNAAPVVAPNTVRKFRGPFGV